MLIQDVLQKNTNNLIITAKQKPGFRDVIHQLKFRIIKIENNHRDLLIQGYRDLRI